MSNDDPMQAFDDLPTAEADIAEDGSIVRRGETVRLIERWIDDRDIDALRAFLDEAWEADIAWLLEQTDAAHRRDFLEVLRPYFRSEILTFLSRDMLPEVMASLPTPELATILQDLDSDDIVDVVQKLEPEQRDEALRLVSRQMRTFVEEGLTFPDESAGRLMQREVVTMPPFWSVSQALSYLRATRDELPERFEDIYLLDPLRRVSGLLPATRLLRARPEVRLEHLATTDFIAIPFDRDQEEVAYDFRRLGLSSAPVVDAGGRLLGVITLDDILFVIEEEAQEDILALGGVKAERESLGRKAWQTTRTRFTWLALNLLTAILASLVISRFEDVLEAAVALAVLMPIVASMGGNAGTQTLTVAVRALATKSLSSANALRTLTKEVIVGAINGVAFAVLMGIITLIWFGNGTIALVIAVAMVVNLVIATFSGVLVPLALERLKVDPAVASAVLLTTITDVVGFFVFLGLAAALLL